MSIGISASAAAGCFGLGLSAGLLALLLANRKARQFLAALDTWVARGSVAALAALSIALILLSSDDRGTDGTPATAAAMPAPGAADATGGSMETATQLLAIRLAAQGGSDADWNLLAQSYDFLGRAADAKLARAHQLPKQSSLADSMATTAPVRPASVMPAMMPQATTATGPVDSLLAQAEQHRRKREFRQACDVYRKIIADGAMTADSWADYADALGSAAPDGSLAGDAAKAIDQALALDPKQTKALWLKASLAHQEHRYAEALVSWRALLVLMPPGSSDARIIEANIAEAQRLASKQG